MDIEAQHILYNLRLLSDLEKKQWLVTKRNEHGKLDIDGICNDGYYNNVVLSIMGDSWEASKECLKQLFCVDVPQLAKKLMDLNEGRYLRNLNEHLKNSFTGLENLRYSYSDKSIDSHIKSFKCDFGEVTHEKINSFLNKDSDSD